MTTTTKTVNRGRDREVICKHCRWNATVWKSGEEGPPDDECVYCKGKTPEEQAARKKFVDEEGAKFGAKVKAEPGRYAELSAELAKVLA